MGVVVVPCSSGRERPNLITIGAISHACADPPMLGVAIGHTRYSYRVFSRADSFVVNAPSEDQVELVDYCGSVSGRNVDKFKECGLTPLQSLKVSSPGIEEFPINIECAIRKSVNLGSHDFFFGEILAVRCDEEILSDDGSIDKEKMKPICAYLNGYWSVGELLLRFGSIKRVGSNRERLERRH